MKINQINIMQTIKDNYKYRQGSVKYRLNIA